MTTTPAGVAAELRRIVGAAHVLEGADIGPRYSQDLWGGGPEPDARLVVRPSGTAEVVEILRLCHRLRRPVVPQGGMTGLVSGGLPDGSELVLSLERMDRIEDVDPAAGTMTVQAGAVLQAVQERADRDGLMFPLDLGSRGSCTIGGCLATNAGGNRVLLYGMTRELVLGVEAVLADGTVVGAPRRLVKDNAGYDLRQLFIGSEGTLGVITRAVLRLRPRPATQLAAFCGVASVAVAVRLLRRLQSALSGMVSAFEVMWNAAYATVLPLAGELELPLAGEHPIYVLVECQGSDAATDRERFVAALAACADLIREARMGESRAEVQRLWAVRERIAVEALRLKPLFGFDIGLPVDEMEPCLRAVDAELRRRWPEVRLLVFGHLGDGNLHFAVVTGEATAESKPAVEEIVYRNVGRRGGSISAEHGIGFQKRSYLGWCRSEAEIELMRTLKRALDPLGLLSRGRVLGP